jgi:hypothetical protein
MTVADPPRRLLADMARSVKDFRQLIAQLRRPCDAWKCSFCWFLSHKEWNAMLHALHGNTTSDDDDLSQTSASVVASQRLRWPAPPRVPMVGALVRRKDDSKVYRVEQGAR